MTVTDSLYGVQVQQFWLAGCVPFLKGQRLIGDNYSTEAAANLDYIRKLIIFMFGLIIRANYLNYIDVIIVKTFSYI